MRYLIGSILAIVFCCSSLYSQTGMKFNCTTTSIPYPPNTKIGNEIGRIYQITPEHYYMLRLTVGYPWKMKNIFIAKYDRNTLDLVSSVPMFDKKNYDSQLFQDLEYKSLIDLYSLHAVFFLSPKTESHDFYYVKTDENGLPGGEIIKLLSIPFKTDQGGLYHFLMAEDGLSFTIIYKHFLDKEVDKEDKYTYYIFNNELKLIKQADFQVDRSLKSSDYILTMKVYNDQSIAGTNVLSGKWKEENEEVVFKVCQIDQTEDGFRVAALTELGEPLTMEVCMSADFIYCAGFYKNKGSDLVKGTFCSKISRKTMLIESFTKGDISQDMLNNIFIKKAADEKGKVGYDMSEIKSQGIYRNIDGSIYIVAEQSNMGTAQYGSAGPMNSVYDFSFGNMIVSKYDAECKLLWCITLPKRSYGTVDDNLGCHVEWFNNKLLVYYVDHTANFEITKVEDIKVVNNGNSEDYELICAVIDENGKIEKNKVFSNKEKKLRFFPPKLKKFSTTDNILIGTVKFPDSKEGLIEIRMDEN